MQITADFIGSNVKLIDIQDDRVVFHPDMRDSENKWFYWAFCVKGAAGRTVTFDTAPLTWIGRHGPAVSHDLEHWHWGGGEQDGHAFTYTFGPDEDCVYFAHDMLYHPARFERTAARLGLRRETLCISEKGADVPVYHFGEGERQILLTARHHCCEATGDYVLEGVLESLCAAAIPGWRITIVPFVDYDGVVAGDQGKNRRPHDHNRDYLDEPLYASIRAIQSIIRDPATVAALDFHSPWHQGESNDYVFIVRKTASTLPEQIRFGKLFMEELTDDAFPYDTANDFPPNTGWNQDATMAVSFTGYCNRQPHMELCCTLETTYFGLPECPVSQDNLVSMGRAFGRALAGWMRERSV
ncbi:MAG: hypothetical protein E7463_01975 [Ruminococcaceae bacterium]|nr:hypothetical protein [Oscillospiraceae bacterium]